MALEIEAELTADYMGQAEGLFIKGTVGEYAHVPAAVITGAFLEKSLKNICYQLSPSEPIINDKGSPLRLTAMFESFEKNEGIY